VFLQNSRRRLVSSIIRLFFYWKSRGIGPRCHGPGPWFWLMSPQHSRSISAIDFNLGDYDFIKTKSYRWSKPGPPSMSGWLTSYPGDGGGSQARHSGAIGAHGSSAPELSGARWRGIFGAKRHGGRWGCYTVRNTTGNGSKTAHGGGFPPLSTGDGERWLRQSSSFKK
jgi:hypothetical protein